MDKLNKDGSYKFGGGVQSATITDDFAAKLSNIPASTFDGVKKVSAGAELPSFTLEGRIFPCKCISVYDGDTIHVAVKLYGKLADITIRMYGYNSAEIRTKNLEEKEKGYAAKKYMEGLVLGKNLIVHIVGEDKYGGRWLGNVYTVMETANNQLSATACVNKIMVAEGYGVEYFGKGEKKY